MTEKTDRSDDLISDCQHVEIAERETLSDGHGRPTQRPSARRSRSTPLPHGAPQRFETLTYRLNSTSPSRRNADEAEHSGGYRDDHLTVQGAEVVSFHEILSDNIEVLS
jgi:hypothetical protein